MQTMQAFYNWLFKKSEDNDPYRQQLNGLTKIDPIKLAVIETEPGWEPWEAQEPVKTTS